LLFELIYYFSHPILISAPFVWGSYPAHPSA
jgi:hypothetical protein